MALVLDCLVMVASEAKCVSCEPIRGKSGKLEGTTLVLMGGTEEGSLVAREGWGFGDDC